MNSGVYPPVLQYLVFCILQSEVEKQDSVIFHDDIHQMNSLCAADF